MLNFTGLGTGNASDNVGTLLLDWHQQFRYFTDQAGRPGGAVDPPEEEVRRAAFRVRRYFTDALCQLRASSAIPEVPNAWDTASARAFEQAGFPAIAATSVSAATLGHRNLEDAPEEQMQAGISMMIPEFARSVGTVNKTVHRSAPFAVARPAALGV